MFTQIHCQAASFDATRTTFGRAAEAEAEAEAEACQQATKAPAEIGAPSSRLAEEAQHQGRATAAFASVLISVALLGSVVIGMTSMADSADMTLAKTSPTSGDLVTSKPACSPFGLKA